MAAQQEGGCATVGDGSGDPKTSPWHLLSIIVVLVSLMSGHAAAAPTVTNTTPAALAEADLGVVNVAVTFSESMSQTSSVTVTVEGISAAPMGVAGGWTDATPTDWGSTFTLVDNDDDTTAAYYVISGARSALGKEMVPQTSRGANNALDVDTKVPTILLSDDGPASIGGGGVTYTFTFSEGVKGFAATEIADANGTKAGAFASGSDGDAAYTPNITPNAGFEEDMTIDVAVGAANDRAGNGHQVATQSVQPVDTVGPNQPSSPDLDAASDNGESDSDDVTKGDTPDSVGTAGSLEGNTTVQRFRGGTTTLGATGAAGDGSWSITSASIPDGSYPITITATDAVGHEPIPSDALPVLIDPQAPPAPASDRTRSPTDGTATNESTPNGNLSGRGGSRRRIPRVCSRPKDGLEASRT